MKRKACPTRPEVLPHVQNLQFNAESSPFHLPPTNPRRAHARRKTSAGQGLASLLPLASSEARSACSSASRSSRVSSSASSKGKTSSLSGASHSSGSALSLCVSATPSPVVCPTPTSILSALKLPPQPGAPPPPQLQPQPLLPPGVGDGDDGGSSSRRRVSQASATDIVAYLSSIRRGSESTLGADATPREAAAAEAALTTAALPSTPLSTTKKVAEFLAHPERCGPLRGGYSFLLEAEAWKEAADAKTAKGERMRAGLAMRLNAVFPSKVDRDGNELPLTDEEWGTMTGHELKVLKKKGDGTPRRRHRYGDAYAKFKAAILSWEQYEKQRNSALACVVVQGVGNVHALPPQQGTRHAEQARIDAVRFDEELRRFHLRREKRIQERARGSAPCLDLLAALPEDVQSRLARHLAPSGPGTPPHDAEACWRQRKQAWLEQYVYHHSSCGGECACELAALLDTATVPARAPEGGASAPSLECTSCSSCALPSLAAATAAAAGSTGLPRPPSAASHVSHRSLRSAGSHATTQSTATTPSFSWSSDEQPSDEDSAPASPSLHSTLASFFPALESSPAASGAARPASEKGSVEGSPLEHTVPQADPLTPTDLRPKRSSSSLKTLLLSEGVTPAADGGSAAQRCLDAAAAEAEASTQQQQPALQTKPSSPGGRKERVSLVVDLNSLLGFGAHGRVYKGVLEGAFGSTQQEGAAADATGRASASKKVVAVKKIPLESLKGKGRDRLGHFGNVHAKGPAAAGHGNDSTPSESGRLKQELDVWQKLTNNVGATGYGAFIVKYYGHTYNKRHREYSLVMEHCRYGSVHDLLNRLWHVRGLQGVGVGLGSVEHGAEELATSLPRTGSIPGPGSIRRKSSTMSLCLSICSGSAEHDDGDPSAIFKHDGTIARLNLEELYLATSIVDDTSGGSADGSSTDRFYGNPSRGTGSRHGSLSTSSRVHPLDGSPRGTQEPQEAASSCASSSGRSRGTARLTAACSDLDGDPDTAAAQRAAAAPAFDPDQPPSLPERCLSRIAAHVLEGLVYLHSQNVIHRDVKTSNMLLGGDGFVKLCDFGVSTMLASDRSLRKSCVGTPGYLPPEVIQEQPYNTSADIWSFGCSLLEMATGKRPYQGLNTAAVMLRTVTQPHPPIPDGLPLNLKLMLLACLQKDPTERPRPQALLAHPFPHAGGSLFS